MKMIIFEKQHVERASHDPSESSLAKLNEISLNASFKYIFVAMTRARFCELDLSLGRRELIIILTSLYFFFFFLNYISSFTEIECVQF